MWISCAPYKAAQDAPSDGETFASADAGSCRTFCPTSNEVQRDKT